MHPIPHNLHKCQRVLQGYVSDFHTFNMPPRYTEYLSLSRSLALLLPLTLSLLRVVSSQLHISANGGGHE